MNADRLIDAVGAVNVPAGYTMRLSEINAIHNAAQDELSRMFYCFNYGFLKGQRAAKAAEKKKRQGAA